MSDRARNNFVLVFVIALVLVSLLVTAGIPGRRQGEEDAPRPRPPGRRRADLPGATRPQHAGELSLDRRTRSTSSATASTRSASASRRSPRRATTRSRSRCRTWRTRRRRRASSARPESSTSTTGRRASSTTRPASSPVPNNPGATGGVARARADTSPQYQAVIAGSNQKAVTLPQRRRTGWQLLLRPRQEQDGARRARSRRRARGRRSSSCSPTSSSTTASCRRARDSSSCRRARSSCRRRARRRTADPGRLLRPARPPVPDRQPDLQPAGDDRPDVGHRRQLRLQGRRLEHLPEPDRGARATAAGRTRRRVRRRTTSSTSG